MKISKRHNSFNNDDDDRLRESIEEKKRLF